MKNGSSDHLFKLDFSYSCKSVDKKISTEITRHSVSLWQRGYSLLVVVVVVVVFSFINQLSNATSTKVGCTIKYKCHMNTLKQE